MEIAVLGLAQSGKSTLFQIMTGVNSSEIFGEKLVRGIASVPDERFDCLVEIFKPAKVTPATVPFVDVNATGGFDSIRQNLSTTDAILHIVSCFSTNDVSEMAKRYNQLEDELIISDLVIVERRIEKLAKLPKGSLPQEEVPQIELMPRLKELLENGQPLRNMEFSKEELTAIRNFAFLSLKPTIVVLNISEGQNDPTEEFKRTTGVKSTTISICCQIEAEVAALPPEEQKEFLESMGITTPAFKNIIQTAFAGLKQIYYFTVGEDEVRAWVVKKGSTAPQAAAAIHKDFERGFIKAEVVSYKDFMANGKSLAGAKSAGKFRLEGKAYIVQDGDIISFLFNV